MTGSLPAIEPNRRYRIKEVSALLGIHRNTLRSYRDKGLIREGIDATGKAIYLGREIMRFYNTTI